MSRATPDSLGGWTESEYPPRALSCHRVRFLGAQRIPRIETTDPATAIDSSAQIPSKQCFVPTTSSVAHFHRRSHNHCETSFVEHSYASISALTPKFIGLGVY